MTDLERRHRVNAITRLAVATRERPEPGLLAVYVESTAMVEAPVLARACDRLSRAATWFPKVSELLAECRAVARADQDRREATQRRLTDGDAPVSDARYRELMASLGQMVKTKSFPKVGR